MPNSKVTLPVVSLYHGGWALVGLSAGQGITALNDAVGFTNGATTNGSKTLTSSTAAFTSADIGRPITGPAAIPSGTVIASINSATSIEMSQAATATVAGTLSFSIAYRSATPDATYLENTGSTTKIGVGFADWTPPALAQVRFIYWTMRIRTPDYVWGGAGFNDRIEWTEEYFNDVAINSSTDRLLEHSTYSSAFDSSLVIPYLVGPVSVPTDDYWNEDENGNLVPITYAAAGMINTRGLGIRKSVGTNRFQLMQVAMVVEYNLAPVVSAVSAQSVGTSRPTLQWTYTDPETDPQDRAWVKVFTSAQADPQNAAGAIYDAELLQGGNTKQITVDLQNGQTYYAYVKAADVGSSGRYGNWSSAGTFTISLTPPPTPTLVATPQPSSARYELVATHGSYASATQRFIIQRSLDAGVTWTTIRSASEVPPSSGSTLTTYDYEVPRGVAARYRVQTVADPPGGRVASAWSVVAAPAALEVEGWWLKAPLRPALNRRVTVLPGFSFVRKEPQSVFEPLGRRQSVVVSDGPRGIQGSLELWAKTKADYDGIEALVLAGQVMWLEDPFGRRWYIKFGEATQWSLLRAAPAIGGTAPIGHIHTVVLPFTEVGVPTGVPS